MNFRTPWVLCLVTLCSTSCLSDESSYADEEAYDEDSEEASPELPPRAPPSPPPTKSGYEDEEFDPCPSVKYELWEREGVKYYIEIEVFCDPIKNINLGCPNPF